MILFRGCLYKYHGLNKLAIYDTNCPDVSLCKNDIFYVVDYKPYNHYRYTTITTICLYNKLHNKTIIGGILMTDEDIGVQGFEKI